MQSGEEDELITVAVKIGCPLIDIDGDRPTAIIILETFTKQQLQSQLEY